MPKVAMQEVTRTGNNGTSKIKIEVDYATVKKAAGVLRAINHSLRQGILSLLEERGPITVTELYNRLNLEQSVASQHLAILRKANVVKTSRDGKFIYYSLNEKRLNEIGELANEIIS